MDASNLNSIRKAFILKSGVQSATAEETVAREHHPLQRSCAAFRLLGVFSFAGGQVIRNESPAILCARARGAIRGGGGREAMGWLPPMSSDDVPTPTKPAEAGLFQMRFDNVLDQLHELVRLGGLIDWKRFDEAFGPLSWDKIGRPAR